MRWAIPICTAAWIATALVCKAVPIREYKWVATASDHVTVRYSWVALNLPPTDDEFAGRLAWSEPPAIALTLAVIGAVRRASTVMDWQQAAAIKEQKAQLDKQRRR